MPAHASKRTIQWRLSIFLLTMVIAISIVSPVAWGVAVAPAYASNFVPAGWAEASLSDPPTVGGAAVPATTPAVPGPGSLYQVSTIGALMEGVYDGVVAIGELRRQGDFGLGTLDGLDGELALLDGKAYQIRTDGLVYPVADNTTTPFAAVTFFRTDTAHTISGPMNWAQLTAFLETQLPSSNLPYAIKVEGQYDYVKARSVPRQERPYPRLIDVVANQATFEFRNVPGTLIGLRAPGYMDGLNVAGYHFHFLSADKKSGGHVMDAEVASGTASISPIFTIRVELPPVGDFLTADLATDKEKSARELQRVER